jgi:hypothetical protein
VTILAKYTTELRHLIEGGFDLQLTDYPIFDESYRALLNQKIIDHYMFNEIGAETPARFRHYLKTKMNEIMPYYNQLYQSTLINFDPMTNFDLKEESTRTSNTDSTADGTNKSSGSGKSATRTETINESENEQTDDLTSVESDTPNGLLDLADIKTNVYASRANRGDNKITNSGRITDNADSMNINAGLSESENKLITEVKNVDDFIKHTYGTIGVKTQQAMLLELRETFINVDMMVISELYDCFMTIY